MLKDCIAKAGKNIPPAYAERMLTRVEALVSEGATVPDAEQRVVREVLAEVKAEGERLAAPDAPGEDKRTKFQRWIAGNKVRVQRQKEAIAAAEGPDGSITLVSVKRPDEVVFFSPNIAPRPGWRVTRFVNQEPYGHFEFNSKQDAIDSYAGASGSWGPPHGSPDEFRPANSTERFSLGDRILEGGDRVGQEDQGRQEALLTDAAASTGPEGWPSPLRTPETDRLRGLVRYRTERNALERERQAARNAGKSVAEIDRRIDGLDAGPRESLGAPDWAMDALRDSGWNTKWPFVVADLGNPSFVAAIKSDPGISDEERAKILSFVPGGEGYRRLMGGGRSSLDAEIRVEADRIRQEYPSAPEFVIESGLSGDDPRKGAVFRDGKVSVYPAALGNRRQARNAILGALGDAGAELFEPSFWDRLWTYARAADPAALRRLMVRADTSTPAGRRAVLGELLMEHSRGMHVSGPLRRMIRALKGYSTKDFANMLARHAAAKELFRPVTRMPSTDKTWLGRRFRAGTGYEAELFPTEDAARAYAGDAGTVRDVTQEKAHADLHGSWYRTLSPRLANLRTLASESGLDAAERQRWENLERHLRGLAEEAEAAALPAMGRIRVNPEDESFPADYAAMAGKELSPRDLDAWNAYRAELEARRAARMIDRLAELERTDRSLTEKEPRWGDPAHPDYATLEDDRKRFRAMTTRLRNRIAKFSDVTRARADEIRGQREVLAQARAAETVLADPFWVQAAEIIDRIDDAGVAPFALEDLAPITRAAAEEVRNQFHAQYLLFRQRAAKLSASENERIAAELRKLRERLTAARADAGAAEVAIKEVRDALAGAHGTSGSLESRAITTALRDLDTAIQIFARELAAARPDTPVWKLREIVEALDPTVPLELREEYRAEVASAMGLSLDALSRILDLIQRYDEFRNGILAMHDAADRATKSATITAIERIEELLARSAATATEAEKMMEEAEAEGDVEAAKTAATGARTIRTEAHTVAARAIARLRRTWKGRERLARSLDDEIADTLVEQLASDFLLESASEEVSDPGFVREMIYNTDDGEYLAPFTRADGTAQPGIHLRPGDEYTPDLLARVSEWRDHARDVAAAPPGSTLNDAETVRGLAVAISAEGDAGVSKYIDAMALPEMRGRAKAPGKALIGLATHSKFGIKTILPALVPGVLGNRLRAAGVKYIESEQRINRVLGEKTRTQHRLIRAATISLGLNPRTEAGKFTAAYNEVAHRLRQFDSGVAPGDILWSRPVRGREVTPELLALFRFHRDVFGQLQDWLGAEPYGGVRMRMPGRRVIRAPAPTGDIGLGRYSNKVRVKKLAEASREAAETGTDTPLLTFWNRDPDALLFHVFDSTRNDLGTTRDPVLLRAEQEAARDLHRRGKDASVPSTVDEWADYLATFITTVPDPRRYARERLLGELAEYGNLARALFPTDSKAAATGAGLYKGENDANEFNTPATKLLYPSSWYTYGASDGLRAAVERTADRRQVEYFAALLAARDDLNARATRVKEVLDRIEAGVDDPTIIDPVREDVRWHTDHIWKSDEVRGRHRVAAAYALMRQRAAVIEAHYGHLSDPRIQDPISRALSNLVPMMLSWYPSMLTNVVSGPIRQGPLLRPLLGNIGAGATVPLGIGASILSHAYEALVGALPKPIRERFKSREEILAWLLSKGLGTSYSREEMAELEAFAGGLPGRSRGGQVWGTFLEGVRVVSERVGVHMGDKLLNRYASRFIVPLVVWRLRTIARAWRERVGPNPDPTNQDHALSAADVRVPYDITRQVGSGDVARIREILLSTGLGAPEDVLAQLEREDVKPRLFWRSRVGNAIGMWVLNEFNVANRLNRPAPSFLGFLWGWAAGATAALIEDARSAPDDRLASRVGNKVVWTTAVATTAALATWARLYSIPLAHAGVSAASAALAAALSPDDDEDEWGLFDHIMDGASRIVGAFQNYTVPRQLPHNRSFWMNAGPDSQPGTPDDQVKDPWEIAGAVGKMVAAGYGWDFDNARTPGLSILNQFIRGGLQFGRGMAQWAEGKIKDDAGMVVGGESDTREGARQLAALTSVWGRTLYNARYPDDQKGRQGRQAILRAANELGIQPAAPPPVASFITPTPVRREFQETGRAILNGDPDAPERARSLAAFVWNRSYDRSIRAGDTEEVARKNADAAVKRNLSGLNPYEASLGRTITPAQYEQLKKALGDNPMIRRDEAAAEAIIRAVSEKPPEGMLPFAPSPAMLSPVRSESGSRGVRRVTLRSSGGGGRRRRASIGRTRGIRRRTRLPKPRKTTVRIRWA